MAKYESVRKYVVTNVTKKTVEVSAPWGRSFWPFTLSTKQCVEHLGRVPEVGQKVVCKRFSNAFTTTYLPTKIVNR